MSEMICPECRTDLIPEDTAIGTCPLCAAPLKGTIPECVQLPPKFVDYQNYDRDGGDHSPELRRLSIGQDYHDERYNDPILVEAGLAWSRTDRALSNMLLGIKIMLVAAAVVVVTIILGYVVLVPAGGRNRETFGFVMIAVSTIAVLFVIIGVIMLLVGYYGCCYVPRESGAKNPMRWSLNSVLLAVLVIVIQGCTGTSVRPGGPRPGDILPFLQFMALLQTGLIVASHVLFILFLRGVAVYFSNPRFSANCVAYNVVYVAYSVVSLMFLFLLPIPPRGPLWFLRNAVFSIPMMSDLTGLYVLVRVALFVWFIFLIAQARNTLRTGIQRNRRTWAEW
ncbi:MAG: hypothetical protein ACFCD0_01635 [Gemmataceae bacterium]